MEMAEIGALPAGGCCRLALSDEDRQARDLFARRSAEAGASLATDMAGNMFAVRAGAEAGAALVATGSHLDTQPHGGKFDGAAGVMAGLEVLCTLADHHIATRKPIAIVNWTNEEGVRFQPGVLGSTAFVGAIAVDALHKLTATDGAVFADELKRIGYLGETLPGSVAIESFFEVHIEQGPILEEAGIELGIVTRAQGIRWIEVEVVGVDLHAGTTPMEARRDSLVAASVMISALNELGHAHRPHARITVGRLFVEPNAVSTIAGRTRFVVDLRHPEAAMLDHLEGAIGDICRASAADRGCTANVGRGMALEPIAFDEGCVADLEAAARKIGYSTLRMLSGAGHDACNLARITPTAMIFVPSRGGISHNEAEWSAPEHLEASCNVLLHAMLARAGVA
jgi:N-carbamoyl-L-amino-acid hydrolase